MHFHMNQRLNDGYPVSLATDAHMECLHDSLDELKRSLPLLGWELENETETTGIRGMRTLEFIMRTDGESRVSFSVWECRCSSGEARVRQDLQFIGLSLN